MIFYDGQKIRPKEVGGGGMFGVDLLGAVGGPMHRTEFWSCYFCGKVRAVRQWKRAEVLELSNEEKDPELNTWSPKQLDSVPGDKLLPDGWGLHTQVFEYQGQKHMLHMLGCAECLAGEEDDESEPDDTAVEEKTEQES